jgi:heat shock protein HslJ
VRTQSRSRRWILLSLAVGLVLTSLAACGADADDSRSATASTSGGTALEGTPWVLMAATTDAPLPAGVEVTALFEQGKVTGTSGCNRYVANYEVKGNELTVDTGQSAGTLMTCGPAAAAVEQAYLQRLGQVASYSIDSDKLVLSDSGNKALLTYGASSPNLLTGAWVVTSFHKGDAIVSVMAGSTVTAVFTDTTISGSGGCNQYSGPVAVNGTKIKIGPVAATFMACSPDIDAQEQAYVAALGEAASYAATTSSLDLFRADGGYAVTLTKG